MSVMKKPEYSTLCPDDMKIKAKEKELKVTVISDGEIEKASMHYCGRDEDNIGRILKKEKLSRQVAAGVSSAATFSFIGLRTMV